MEVKVTELEVLSTGGGVYTGGGASDEEEGIGDGVDVSVTELETLSTGGGV